MSSSFISIQLSTRYTKEIYCCKAWKVSRHWCFKNIFGETLNPDEKRWQMLCYALVFELAPGQNCAPHYVKSCVRAWILTQSDYIFYFTISSRFVQNCAHVLKWIQFNYFINYVRISIWTKIAWKADLISKVACSVYDMVFKDVKYDKLLGHYMNRTQVCLTMLSKREVYNIFYSWIKTGYIRTFSW